MENQNYHEQVMKKNTLKLREYFRTLPSFCQDYFLGTAQLISSRTQLAYAFDLKIFLSGFFGNSILSIALTFLGNKLNVDIYLAAIVVFVGRMFTNLAIIRRYYLEKWIKFTEKMKETRIKAEESEK